MASGGNGMNLHITFKEYEAPLYMELMKKSAPSGYIKDLIKEDLECTETVKSLLKQLMIIMAKNGFQV